MPKKPWIAVASLWAVGGFLCPELQAADSRFAVKVFGTEEGLPQSVVLAITQTRDGYLWVGTYGGLARFDGARFTAFDENNTPGLNSSQIVRLFEDSKTNLWIGTETAGVALLQDGKVTSLSIGRGSREGRLMAVCEDSNGAVWLYTANGQLCRYRDKRVDVWSVGSDRASNCRALIAAESGLLWVGTDWSLTALGPIPAATAVGLPVAQEVAIGRLDFLLASKQGGYWRLANGRIQKYKGNRIDRDLGPYPWKTVPVVAACEDLEGNLIVGTYGDGVYWFDAAGHSTRLSSENGLSHNSVLSVIVDREGCLWVGTNGGGLNRVRRKVFEALEISAGSTVQSVSEDVAGNVWIGYNGDRVDRWSGTNSQRFELVPDSFLDVKAVFVDKDQRILVGTWNAPGQQVWQWQGERFRPAPGFEGIKRNVSAIYQDRLGDIWLGTQGGLVQQHASTTRTFTSRDGLSADEVRAIAEDRDGNLWVGTEAGGLNQLREGRFVSFGKTNGLPSDNISSLYADPEGVLWVGTGGGLARFSQGKWKVFSKKEGLSSSSVGYLAEDTRGYLWIGSNSGLMRVRKQDLNQVAQGLAGSVSCRAYGESDGLPAGECTQGSQPGALRGRDGKLWFPTIKGLASVQPDQLKINTNQLPVVIESVLIGGELQNTNNLVTGRLRSVKVDAGKERLEIHFTSLNLAARERARFRYRMEEHEVWTELEPGSIPAAYYTKLQPGNYHFQVTACNEDQVWNEKGSVLAVIVMPPFWKTWWFRGVSITCLVVIIVASVHFASTQRLKRQVETLRQQEALEKERARIARDLHDQLGANLTQVALLGEMAETDKDIPEEVVAHAQQICQTARDTTRSLDEIVWTVNPSNDTLDGLVNYVCKYAQEYLAIAGVRYRLDVPDTLPATPISPELRHNVFLASKEAITNVVRHAKATSVCIRLRLDPNRFTFEIEDNGRGLGGLDPKAAALRNGLRNMRKRMEDIGGEFSIEPAPELGAVVRLSAPIAGS